MEPDRSVIAPELRHWMRTALDDDSRAAVIRLRFGQDPDRLAEVVTELGGRVQTIGAASVVASVTPAVLRAVGEQEGVRRVDAPVQFFPQAPTSRIR